MCGDGREQKGTAVQSNLTALRDAVADLRANLHAKVRVLATIDIRANKKPSPEILLELEQHIISLMALNRASAEMIATADRALCKLIVASPAATSPRPTPPS